MEDTDEEYNIPTPNSTKSSWVYLIRQMFICSGITSYFFISGLYFGAPTVYIPQIRKEANSTAIISMEMVSWLFSITNYGSVIWTILIPLLAVRYGRKIPFLIAWVDTMICILLIYFSTGVTELLVSNFFLGTPTIVITMSIFILTEYTSPKYRGILITFKAATFYWGVWVSNAIGTFFHWKNIFIVAFVCCIYNTSILFWPESPIWLATKGRFKECAKSHRWLKGQDIESEEELKQLIFLQKEQIKRKQELEHEFQENIILKLIKTIKRKSFYKPLIYSILAVGLYHFSGKMICSGYVLDIIIKISSSESTAYEGMLVLDGVTVLGMYVGVFLTKFLKRRTLLLGCASIGVVFLLILSIYLYLIHIDVITENKYLTLFFLMSFSIAISCGPMIMSMCCSSELTPLKDRSLFLFFFGLYCNIIMGVTLKVFPFVLKHLNTHGSFLLFAITSLIFILFLYRVLPETKDQTIQDIENYFLDDDKNNILNKETLLTKEPYDKNMKPLLHN